MYCLTLSHNYNLLRIYTPNETAATEQKFKFNLLFILAAIGFRAQFHDLPELIKADKRGADKRGQVRF